VKSCLKRNGGEEALRPNVKLEKKTLREKKDEDPANVEKKGKDGRVKRTQRGEKQPGRKRDLKTRALTAKLWGRSLPTMRLTKNKQALNKTTRKKKAQKGVSYQRGEKFRAHTNQKRREQGQGESKENKKKRHG